MIPCEKHVAHTPASGFLMRTAVESSDSQLLSLLRRNGAMSVGDVSQETEVTATAVRQRLTRLIAQGLVERKLVDRGGSRGRPGHRYSLTEKARRQVGTNYGDLALMLWDEVRAVKDPQVRRGLFQRIAGAMARLYADRMTGTTTPERMESLRSLFAERRVPLEVSEVDGLPMLTVLDCPYPELAERDRGICAMEKMLFAELLAAPVRLTQCRLEGHTCCQFETN